MNTLKYTILILFIFLFSTVVPAENLESQIVRPPGYFQSIWNIAKFYINNRGKTHYLTENTPDLKSHYEFLAEKRNQNSVGKMTSFFDSELQTRLYYSATGKPNSDGIFPIVDSNAKGLVIYFHGSGTEKGSGANFNYKGNKLSVLGYSSLSMDYPFHQDGPIDSKYGRTAIYMEYILRMITKYRIAGKPVTLVGHSFGVNVIAEFITRYPFAVDSAILLSPAGFNKELVTWSQEKTIHMLKTFPHFVYNELGSRWAGFINRGFQWSKTKNRKFTDPTRVNPGLKVRIVSGEWEEFIPGPLDKDGLPLKVPRTYDVLGAMKHFFSKAETILEPNVGHLVHSHIDSNGHDLVLREILAANGESIADSKSITDSVAKSRKNALTERDLALQKQLLETFFQDWLKETYGSEYLRNLHASPDEVEATKLARRVLADFKKFEDWRTDLILIDLQKKIHPFYIQNKEKIESVIKTKNLNERTQVINAYYIYLAQEPTHQASDTIQDNLPLRWKQETGFNPEARTRIEKSAMCKQFYK